MSTFAQTLSPTPFGVYDTDTQFQTEADKMVVFVKRMLGDDVLSVELTKKQVWACFEESMLEYGSIVNQYQAQSQLSSFLGQATGSLSGSEQVYIKENLEFLVRAAEPYAVEAGIGGSYDSVSGSITLEPGRQDYDLYSELRDANGTTLFDNPLNSPKGKMKIREIFHFSPSAAYRFFDTTSAVNYLNNEFSFESFTPETVFYVLPVFEDILRAGMMDISQRVRRSNYSYKIMGRNLRIFPTPALNGRQHLFVRVQFASNPMAPLVSGLSGSLSGTITDQSLYGVSNLSNVPFGNLQYSKINSIGKQWIRQFTLARSKEVLGYIRSKFSTIPIPGSDLTLNGADLLSSGREETKALKEELKTMLESLTYDKIAERNAVRAEMTMKQLKMIPMPLGKAIFTG